MRMLRSVRLVLIVLTGRRWRLLGRSGTESASAIDALRRLSRLERPKKPGVQAGLFCGAGAALDRAPQGDIGRIQRPRECYKDRVSDIGPGLPQVKRQDRRDLSELSAASRGAAAALENMNRPEKSDHGV